MEWVGTKGNFVPFAQSFSPKASSVHPANVIGMNRYLIAIKLQSHIYSKVSELRDRFYTEYPSQKFIDSDNAITIAEFFAREDIEDTIARWLHRICRQVKSFEIRINNFGGFPPGSIYLRLMDLQPIRAFAGRLGVIDDFLFSHYGGSVRWIDLPKLTVADRLPLDIYEKALREYVHRSFFESFIAGEILMMRQSEKDGPAKLINVFGLLPHDNNLFN